LSQTGGGSSISERAIALRDQQREHGGLTQTREENLKAINPPVRVPGPTGKISKAVANVMKAVGTVKRRGRNEFFNYSYVRFEDLLYVITPLMGENGLAITQSETSVVQEKNTLTVKYEFVVYHESGESYPPQIHTGMSLLLTRKGTYDDKAINKCHTQARKYFFQGLFNVPTGDFEDNDADEGDANQRQGQRPVPAPKKQSTSREAASGGGDGGGGDGRAVNATGPHKIVLGQGAGADQWAGAYLKVIEKAKTEAEVKEWDKANDEILQSISDRYSKIYDMIETAVQQRLQDLGAKSDPREFGDGPSDLQERMNWIATTLQSFTIYKDAEAWWNERVAPSESNWDIADWEMLMAEWKRTEERLVPPE